MNKFVRLTNDNGEELSVTHSTFPAGEVYVKIDDVNKITKIMHVSLFDASADSIMRAIMLASACTVEVAHTVKLHTTYMPYSRQDRVCKTGESNSFWEFKYILNEYFDEIDTVDVHNPEVCFGITNYPVDYHGDMLNVYRGTYQPIYVAPDALALAPDKGAMNRAKYFAGMFDIDFSYLEKTRTDSGITQSISEVDKVSQATAIVIVDDICDGGRTFIEAAKEIRKVNIIANLYLIVSHGIFSAGLDELKKYFSGIYVPDNQYNRNRLEML